MRKENWEADLAQWEAENLTPTGHYRGSDLSNYAFPYRYGQHVPVVHRYSGLLSWQWARKCDEFYRNRKAI